MIERTKKVRLIGVDAKMIGVLEYGEAEAMAHDQNLDLILVTQNAEIPVFKLGDAKKMRYHEEKMKRKEARKQRGDVMKIVKISFNEGTHDMQTKIKRLEEFLDDGLKVKVVMFLAGREKSHFDLALEKTKVFLSMISTEYKTASELKKLSNGFETIIFK
ncbi:MAG TPA: translation initiation factor IF-3 [Candidatus Paceibacterota bacterium]|jgi:translation initiation factor IF-3|nr:translation initiation factor IF-3 [Candidatus Paceibacterota bacterium]HRZ29305.1 translation initiation factor IF-3 [Candidatus Paceibacterota bacterium]